MVDYLRSNVDARLQDSEDSLRAVHEWFPWNGFALNPDNTAVILNGSATKFKHLDLILSVL